MTVLAARAAAHAPLDDPYGMAWLLKSLRDAGVGEPVNALVQRLPGAGHFSSFISAGDHEERFRFGREPDGSAADPWGWDDLD